MFQQLRSEHQIIFSFDSFMVQNGKNHGHSVSRQARVCYAIKLIEIKSDTQQCIFMEKEAQFQTYFKLSGKFWDVTEAELKARIHTPGIKIVR